MGGICLYNHVKMHNSAIFFCNICIINRTFHGLTIVILYLFYYILIFLSKNTFSHFPMSNIIDLLVIIFIFPSSDKKFNNLKENEILVYNIYCKITNYL